MATIFDFKTEEDWGVETAVMTLWGEHKGERRSQGGGGGEEKKCTFFPIFSPHPL